MSIKLHFITAILGLLLIPSVSAKTLVIVDQTGKPVANAVVSIPASHNMDSDQIAVMDQVSRQFVPRVLVVQSGQKVVFPNSDSVRHHVYSFSAIKPFEISLYKGSDEPPVLYDKPGIAVLGCNIHDDMEGFIYVVDNEIAKLTGVDGSVTFAEIKVDKVDIWHESLSLAKTEKLSLSIDPERDVQSISLTLIEKTKSNHKHTFGSSKFAPRD